VLRYYAIATVIVLVVSVVATAWSSRNFMRFRLGESNHSAPAQHVSSAPPEQSRILAVRGDAPWALSALPDCFRQQSESTGSVAYVRAKIPADARPIPEGTRLVYGSCALFVGDDVVLVDRGADRMRIPPHATLYRAGTSLALLRITGQTAVLRTYDVVTSNQ
jgi:hypothetical protein